jgi:hypothetical protein
LSEVLQLLKSVLAGVPSLLLNPVAFPFFWILVVLVGYQYRRVAENERRIYGVAKNRVWRQVAVSVVFGLAGGILASLLLAFVGASLTGTGVYWLLPLALLLLAFSPRLMCFSYAGGIVSFSYLIFGWPKVHVPSLMALVAVLHVTESLLIMMRGASCATPLVVRGPSGGGNRPGFMLQGFWPLPLLLLFIVTLPPEAPREGLLEMPSWWPLIVPPGDLASQPNAVFTLFPVAAVLGYSDLATRMRPAQKARRSALALAAYSVVLLLLAIAASRTPVMVWLAALWGPLGHELVIRAGTRGEFRGPPALRQEAGGLTVLDVLPGGGADRSGIRTGDVLLSVGGAPATDAAAVEDALLTGTKPFPVVYRRDGREREALVESQADTDGGRPRLGIIPLPPDDDPPQVEVRTSGPGCSLLGRLFRRKG